MPREVYDPEGAKEQGGPFSRFRSAEPESPLDSPLFRWIMVIVWFVLVMIVFISAFVMSLLRLNVNFAQGFLDFIAMPWVLTIMAIVKESFGAFYIIAVWLGPRLLWLHAIALFGYVFASVSFALVLALVIPKWYTITSLIITSVLCFGAFILTGFFGWAAEQFLNGQDAKDRYLIWLHSSRSTLSIIYGVLAAVVLLQGIFGFQSLKNIALWVLLAMMLVVISIRSLQTHLNPGDQWTSRTLQWRLYALLSLTLNFHFTLIAAGVSIGVVDYSTTGNSFFGIELGDKHKDGEGVNVEMDDQMPNDEEEDTRYTSDEGRPYAAMENYSD